LFTIKGQTFERLYLCCEQATLSDCDADPRAGYPDLRRGEEVRGEHAADVRAGLWRRGHWQPAGRAPGRGGPPGRHTRPSHRLPAAAQDQARGSSWIV
jgi:hypothetical protein